MITARFSLLVMLLSGCLCGCAAKQTESPPLITKSPPATTAITPLSPFIRRIFEDRSGRLWFGTNSDGVGRYNGKVVEFFCVKEGFPGEAFVYDGKSCTNFGESQGLSTNAIQCTYQDRSGRLWLGG
ncbi:MAG: hypothetical protein NT059_07525 [Planctomycetota bacterium]|nr:hypothetical protein [Planctomycetota bacterium]